MRRKLLQGLADGLADFGMFQMLFWQRIVGQQEIGNFLKINLRLAGAAAMLIDHFVRGNAEQPGAQFALSPKPPAGFQGGDKGFLNDVLRVLSRAAYLIVDKAINVIAVKRY